MKMSGAAALFAISVLTLLAADAPANMSGTWKLNAGKSRLGSHPAPSSLQVVIDHQEPKLKYTGRIYTPSGEGDSQFAFDGAIDGKSYPVKVDTVDQTILFKRVNPYTVSSEMRTKDGALQESAVTSISRDGKTLTRRIERTTSHGKDRWVEVYDKV